MGSSNARIDASPHVVGRIHSFEASITSVEERDRLFEASITSVEERDRLFEASIKKLDKRDYSFTKQRAPRNRPSAAGYPTQSPVVCALSPRRRTRSLAPGQVSSR